MHLCLYFVCIRSICKRCLCQSCKLTKSTVLLVWLGSTVRNILCEVSESKDEQSKDYVYPSIGSKDKPRRILMDFEGYAILRSIYGSFDGNCGRQIVLRTVCLILWPDLLCVGINTHVVCCVKLDKTRDLRGLWDRCTHRESLRAFYQNTHTHTKEFAS